MLEREKETAYAYWLANGYGIGIASAESLLCAYHSAEAVYRAGEKELEKRMGKALAKKVADAKKGWEVEAEYRRLQESGIRFVPFWQEDYPKRLLSIPGKPVGIYVRGELPSAQRKAVAVIGTRNCSPYGVYAAKEFASVLAKAGVEIISGMARGIDSIGQQAALEAGGRSFAVLGCGVDVCYPQSSRRLYRDLQERGGVLSAYPPGTVPKAELFPPRNRIISGLSDAVLVVEASLKSGTMITVDMALEQGREVYVVPGRLTDRCSDGCNRLIWQGAGIVLSPEDMLRQLGITGKELKRQSEEGGRLSEKEQKILSALDVCPKTLEQIHKEAGAGCLQEVMQLLICLCMQGRARCIGGNYYVKNAGSMQEQEYTAES